MRYHDAAGVGPLLEQLQRRKAERAAEDFLRLVLRRGAGCAVVLLAVGTLWSAVRGGGSSAPAAAADGRRLHCFLLLDRSGSMRSVAEAVVEGFNDFLSQQQKVEGTMLITLAQFDSLRPLEYILDAQDVRTVQPLQRNQFRPQGRKTKLTDAVAGVIRHAERVEREPGLSEVLVVVLSDGAENASKEVTQAQASHLVEAKRRDYACGRVARRVVLETERVDRDVHRVGPGAVHRRSRVVAVGFPLKLSSAQAWRQFVRQRVRP